MSSIEITMVAVVWWRLIALCLFSSVEHTTCTTPLQLLGVGSEVWR
jgi:hypothetical protein